MAFIRMRTAPELRRAARHPRTVFAAEPSRPSPSTPTTDSTRTSTLTWAPCTAECTTVWPAATSIRPISTPPLACVTNSEVSPRAYRREADHATPRPHDPEGNVRASVSGFLNQAHQAHPKRPRSVTRLQRDRRAWLHALRH